MKTQVQKWGNSLALRIPKGVAEELGLTQGGSVEVKVQGGALVVTPTRPRYTLTELLDKMTPENMADDADLDWGEPVGQEEW